MLIISRTISFLRCRRRVIYANQNIHAFINQNGYILYANIANKVNNIFYMHNVYIANYAQLLFWRAKLLGQCAMRHLVPVELNRSSMYYIEDEEYIIRTRYKK